MQSIASSHLPWPQSLISYAPVIIAIAAIFTLGLNFCQSRRTNAQARATIVANCLERFMDDKDMKEIFYRIDHSNFQYDPKNFEGEEIEKQLDKLLMHFSAAALAWQADLLKTRDLRPLQYFVGRVLRDKEVKNYLKDVFEYSSQENLGEHPYKVLSKM